MTDIDKKPEAVTPEGNSSVLPEKADPVQGAVRQTRPVKPDPRQRIPGITGRTQNGTYIIEDVKRKSNRVSAVIAITVLFFMLSGFIFYYGQAIAGPVAYGTAGETPGKIRRVKGINTPVVNIPTGSGGIELTISASSVEKDINVRIIGDGKYPVLGYEFSIEVTSSKGEKAIYTDDSKTGRFYIDNLESGMYTVSMLPFEGFATPDPVEVEVLEKVQFVPILNIEEKIVNQKNVNSAAEDPQYNNAGNTQAGNPGVAEPPRDTVEVVESRTQETRIKRYTAHVDEKGRLYTREGVITSIVPVIVRGYLTETGEYTIYEPETPPEEPEDEPINVNLFEKDANGNYIYDITEQIEVKITYFGWQIIQNKRYLFDKDGNKVTGEQTIQGHVYRFDENGMLIETGSSRLGVDVSTWQDRIDWKKVKAAGVDFVMIRAGFRGYGSGLLVEDDMFYTNLAGAKAAGLSVGVYFFSQAINEVEGVEEASMVLSLLKKYGISIDYPIAFDSEYSGAAGNTGRADRLTKAERTAVAVAFCQTIRNGGGIPMVYASKSWLENNLSTSAFSGFYIWLAHYTPDGKPSSYTGRYEMWQYTSQGSIDGIKGNVDLNTSSTRF